MDLESDFVKCLQSLRGPNFFSSTNPRTPSERSSSRLLIIEPVALAVLLINDRIQVQNARDSLSIFPLDWFICKIISDLLHSRDSSQTTGPRCQRAKKNRHVENIISD